MKCFPSEVMSMVFNYFYEHSIDLIICPSYFYQYVIFLSDPVVKIWYYSELSKACLNAVDSNKHKSLVWDLRSHIMQEPSPLAETAWLLSLLIWIDQTRLLCYLSEASMTWVCLVIFQILISPSAPPEIILFPSFVAVTDVHPWLWASLITYSNFPDCGKKALIFPSLHPEIRDFPSCIKNTLKH